MRVMLDILGDSHSDLFIKLDVTPSLLIVADSYYLSDFLETESVTKEELVLQYIQYLEGFLDELSNEELFLPIDLNDEYIGGLIFRNWKKGLVEITKCYNKSLFGWAASKSSFHSKVEDNWAGFKRERTLHVSKKSVINGLVWSSENLKENKSTS